MGVKLAGIGRRLLSLALLAAFAAAEDDMVEAPPPPAAEEALQWEVEGYLKSEFVYRSVGSEDDLDFYQDFHVDVSREGARPVSARASGRLFWDLAGNQQPNDLLRSYWDGFGTDAQVRMYEAWAQVDRLMDEALSVRAGRMFLDEGTWFHIDGVRLDLDRKEDIDYTTVFGVPVRFGEPSRSGNWMAGLVMRHRLDPKTRYRVEYYHVSESFEGINDPVIDPVQQPVSLSAERLEDDYLGFTVWHDPDRAWHLFGRFSLLEWDANELQLRVRWRTEDGRVLVIGEWYQLFSRLNNVTNDLSPFVPMLGSYFPFYRASLRATYRHGEDWVFQSGISHRELEEEADEGTFNHEYNHYYVSATRVDLQDGRMDLTITANGYESTGNDVWAVTSNLDYRLDPEWTLSGGVDYSFFKYDWFQNTEREDVWTWFLRARWKAKKDVRADFEAMLEDDRFDVYWSFVASVVVRF